MNQKTILIDVRTPEEFIQGHYKDAINFNLSLTLTVDYQLSTVLIY